MRRKLKKLNYELVDIEGYDVYLARSSSTNSMSITIKPDNKIYFTIPIFVFNFSAINYFKSKIPWIERVLKKNKSRLNENSIIINTNFKLKAKEERILISRIMKYIKEYEKLMKVKINEVKLRKMTSYGICHVKERNIVFSKALHFLPDEFLEAIVVHEIAHIFVPNHSKKFYNKIEEFLPEYRKIWRKYKKIIVFVDD